MKGMAFGRSGLIRGTTVLKIELVCFSVSIIMYCNCIRICFGIFATVNNVIIVVIYMYIWKPKSCINRNL